MSSDGVSVSVNGLGKCYQLYAHPQDRLKHQLFWRFGRHYGVPFWALRNISFEIRRGEAFGIIGRNGSGKSTLLQILAGTLQPSEGSFQVQGRIAALLELGAGFNFEYTGRENIFLNGMTLGISEKEMHRQTEAIIDFAQVGEFIDQPVKLYSSGMFVRLAFAIATCIEPDILLVDEALAVGDAGFVIKCMNRMKQLRERGATIILVTHDVQTVRSFCDTALWLHQGAAHALGSPIDTTGRYLQFLFENQSGAEPAKETPRLNYAQQEVYAPVVHTTINLEQRSDLVRWGSGEIRIESCAIYSDTGSENSIFEYGCRLHIEVNARAVQSIPSRDISFGFALRNSKGLDLITSTTYEQNINIANLDPGQTVHLAFELENILSPGSYALVLNAEHREQAQPYYFDFVENAVIFTVVSRKPIFSLVLPKVSTSYYIS